MGLSFLPRLPNHCHTLAHSFYDPSYKSHTLAQTPSDPCESEALIFYHPSTKSHYFGSFLESHKAQYTATEVTDWSGILCRFGDQILEKVAQEFADQESAEIAQNGADGKEKETVPNGQETAKEEDTEKEALQNSSTTTTENPEEQIPAKETLDTTTELPEIDKGNGDSPSKPSLTSWWSQFFGRFIY